MRQDERLLYWNNYRLGPELRTPELGILRRQLVADQYVYGAVFAARHRLWRQRQHHIWSARPALPGTPWNVQHPQPTPALYATAVGQQGRGGERDTERVPDAP